MNSPLLAGSIYPFLSSGQVGQTVCIHHDASQMTCAQVAPLVLASFERVAVSTPSLDMFMISCDHKVHPMYFYLLIS